MKWKTVPAHPMPSMPEQQGEAGTCHLPDRQQQSKDTGPGAEGHQGRTPPGAWQQAELGQQDLPQDKLSSPGVAV